MKIITVIILFLINQTLFGQTLTNVKVNNTSEEFEKVRDSVVKLMKSKSFIAIKICERYCELYLFKDSLKWKGCFIKDLAIDGLYEPNTIIVDEKELELKTKRLVTKIVSFDADNLINELEKYNLNQIKQLTKESIQNKYSQKNNKRQKKIIEIYSLPSASHDCNMTIYDEKKSRGVTYSNALIQDEQYHFIPTLKIFYEINAYLMETFSSYYH